MLGWNVVSCTLMSLMQDTGQQQRSVITRNLGLYGAGLRAWPGQDRRP